MTFDPLHYKLRVEHIGNEVSRLPRNAPKQLLLVGDHVYETNKVEEIAGHPVLNMGVKGDEIDKQDGGVLRRLNLLPMAQAGNVILMIGFNDIISGKQLELLERQYRELVRLIRGMVPAATLRLQTLLPTRDRYERHIPDIAMFNVMVEETAHTMHLHLIDAFAPMQDEDGMLRQNYSPDGYMLNDTGYEALNEILVQHMKSGQPY